MLELRDAADGAASAAVRVGLTTLAASPSLELVLTGAGGSPRAAANWSLAGAGADAFRHVAIVLTPPLARLYVDGAEHDSSPRSLPPDAFPPAGGESANNTAWPGGNCSPSPPSPAEAILRALAVFPGAALSAEEVADGGHEKVVELLANRDANLDAQAATNGWTALHIAAFYDRRAVSYTHLTLPTKA